MLWIPVCEPVVHTFREVREPTSGIAIMQLLPVIAGQNYNSTDEPDCATVLYLKRGGDAGLERRRSAATRLPDG
jgi:hypothetical protein